MFKKLFTEAWYDKYIKKDNQVIVVINYYYGGRDEDGDDNVHASGNYDAYSKEVSFLSRDLNIDWDAQGSAYALFDEDHIREIISNKFYYNETTDEYFEIDKIKYLKKPNKKAKESMLVEALVTLKKEV